MSSPDKSKWYSEVQDLCFEASIKIPDWAFLFLFAPHCLAANSNLGKKGEERTGGAANKDERPTEKEIQKKQKELLLSLKNSISEYAPSIMSESIKSKTTEFSDKILDKNLTIKADKNFAKKNTSYKKDAYLNFYLGTNDYSPKEIFENIIDYYKEVFDKIYSGYDDEAAQRLKALKKKCKDKGVDFELINIDADSSQSKQMSQCTAALMLLAAAPDKFNVEYRNIRNELLGLWESESTGTVFISTVESITIKGEDYIRMSSHLLENNPEFRDLEMIYSQIKTASGKKREALNGDLLNMANKLKVAAADFGNKLIGEILNGGGFPGTPQQQEQYGKLQLLLKSCEALTLSEH